MVQNKYFRYLLERLAVIYKNSWKETATTSEEIQQSGRRKWFNLEIICPSYSAFIQQYLALVARIVLEDWEVAGVQGLAVPSTLVQCNNL